MQGRHHILEGWRLGEELLSERETDAEETVEARVTTWSCRRHFRRIRQSRLAKRLDHAQLIAETRIEGGEEIRRRIRRFTESIGE